VFHSNKQRLSQLWELPELAGLFGKRKNHFVPLYLNGFIPNTLNGLICVFGYSGQDNTLLIDDTEYKVSRILSVREAPRSKA
jgi:hypothetical protein